MKFYKVLCVLRKKIKEYLLNFQGFFFFQIIQLLNFWVRKVCEIEINVVFIERVFEYENMDKEVSIFK